MIIIMITHDERFMVYGSKTYMINDGHLVNTKQVEEWEKIETTAESEL